MKHDWTERRCHKADNAHRVCRACDVQQEYVPYTRTEAGFHRWNGERLERVSNYDPNARYLPHKGGWKWSPAVGRCKGKPAEAPKAGGAIHVE